MPADVDIAIIGGGPGGYSTALRAAELGKSVALIERDPSLGGTCLNRGCVPSKALITASRTLQSVQDASRMGIQASVSSIDFDALRDYKLGVVETMTSGLAGLLARRGVVVYRGQAELADQRTVVIRPSGGSDGSGQQGGNSGPDQVQRFNKADVAEDAGNEVRLTAKDIVLSIGSAPRPLPTNPFGGAIIDSTQALNLDKFPASAVIIGAGAVAIEFATMWRQAGTDVSLLIRKDRVLSAWDRRVGSSLTRELKRQGIKVISRSRVTGVDTRADGDASVHYQVEGQGASSKDGQETEDPTVFGQVVLVAIGRDPQTKADWFGSLGIELDEHGLVRTDPLGRTSVEHVWALGDITAGPALAHRAFAQGIAIAEAIAGLNPRPVDPATVPTVVFSTPEAASVGLTAQEAKDREDIRDVKETPYPMMGNARMLMSGSAGSLTIVTGSYGDQEPVILGVHMLAPDASDLIAEAQELVGNRVPLSAAARLIHPHPTLSETLGEALLKADGRPLHTL
ncbi:dihydrolipoamide dehydrogenase [Bifidobacterium aemilianum]|uniref:Dihydrolipoamide dehydrogenase n=1 Tax=Bifidobacterium aemilianum TaxID=2493120 RepID=A0A366K9F7_9BIFI|nr:FAD-dependent oxidoreductase [Bifidobacterium aemilianum]RBP98380.1 dihydrolipoamide dehydrogenase [Bifidobacterium aemilianum]